MDLDSVNRSLAKLRKAVKVADTSNQREAECEAFPPIARSFRKDTESFEKAEGVFNKDMLAGSLTVPLCIAAEVADDSLSVFFRHWLLWWPYRLLIRIPLRAYHFTRRLRKSAEE